MKILKEVAPIKGSTPQAITNAVLEALNNGATKILYDKSRSYILYQRPLKDDETEISEIAEVYRVARLNEIIDIGADGLTPGVLFYKIFSIFNDRRLYPSYMLVKSIAEFNRWLGISPHIRTQIFMGTKLYEYEAIEDDVVLVSGTESKTCEPFDISLTVKGYFGA